MPGEESREVRFVRYLTRMMELDGERTNRAVIAVLRRGAGGQMAPRIRMAPYVAPFLGDDPEKSTEDAYYWVAALFADHVARQGIAHDPPGTGHFGAALRDLLTWARMRDRGGPGLERRILALLAADRATVPVHVRHLIPFLAQASAPVDWANVLRDLRSWEHPQRVVQRRWANEAWSDGSVL